MMIWQITNQELRYAQLIADGRRAEADLIVELDLDEKRFARIDAAA